MMCPAPTAPTATRSRSPGSANCIWPRAGRRSARGRLPPIRADRSALEHQLYARRIEEQGDIGEGAAVHHDEIGEAPPLDGAEIALEAETLGRPLRGRAKRLHRGEARLDQVFELQRIFRMAVASGVGAGGDRHAQLE